jgi:hypothetical protein
VLEARALVVQARVLTFRGDERALELAKRALVLAEGAGDTNMISRAHGRLAWDHMRLGRFEASLAACERGLEVTRRLGTATMAYYIELARIEALYRLGRWDDALRRAAALPQRPFEQPLKDPVVPPALYVRPPTACAAGSRRCSRTARDRRAWR